MSTEVDYTLCRYCREGYTSLNSDGEPVTEIKHGVARMAPGCRCECHAEQIVTKASYNVRMTVTLDVKEAFLRWCEENGYTQADFPEDDDDVYGNGEDFAEWWADDILDDSGTDVTGYGVLTYEAEADGYDFYPLEGVDRDRLLALAVPLLPRDPEWPLDGKELGMDPLFENGEI